MRDKVIEFIKKASNNDGNSCVNYKPYEYGNLIESISFMEAVEKFMQDFEEMKIFASSFGIENKAFEMTCSIWREHIVVY